MADPFSVNPWAAIWVDMNHECMWNGERNVCSGELINNNPWTWWHAYFFIIPNAPSFVVAFSFSALSLLCLSDDGDASFDDDFDRIGNSVSSSHDFLFYLSPMMLFKAGPFIPVSMPALQCIVRSERNAMLGATTLLRNCTVIGKWVGNLMGVAGYWRWETFEEGHRYYRLEWWWFRRLWREKNSSFKEWKGITKRKRQAALIGVSEEVHAL